MITDHLQMDNVGEIGVDLLSHTCRRIDLSEMPRAVLIVGGQNPGRREKTVHRLADIPVGVAQLRLHRRHGRSLAVLPAIEVPPV